MAVVIVVFVMAASIVVSVSMVVVIVASAVITMVFVLAVMMAVVMANLFAVFTGVEIPFPAAMTAPVGVLAAYREWAVIAEARIVGAVDVTAETHGTVKPRTCSEEDSATKPSWSVVAKWCAPIGCVIEVAIGADWLDANVDCDLYFCFDGRSG